MIARKILIAVFGLLLASMGNVYAEARSGYEYIKPATRAMQDDDFENPGLLSVERGEELFSQEQGQNGKSCASCHGEDGETLNIKAIARYPVYNDDSKEIITLQKRISR